MCKYKLPPGPHPWPVIGNLNLIGPLPHHSIHELSQRYGPLMSLRFGSTPVVVGSSVDTARFFLKEKDLAFIDRPRTAAGRYTTYNYCDMVWAPYGAYWRQGRKLWQVELLNSRRLASLEHVRCEELCGMLKDLHGVRGTDVVLREHLYMLNVNVISRMVLGKKYVLEDDCITSGSAITSPEEFRWMVDEIFFLNGVLNIGDMIPWLGWLDLQGYVKRMKRLAKMFDRFLEHVLDEHAQRRRREGEAFVAKDMVDLLLELADDPNLKVPIKRDGVKGHTLELIGGGTDTSAVTIEWAMSELLRNPEVLAKATGELDRVIGRERLVTEGDILNLPYLQAIVKETMRMHPVTPLLAPRLSRLDASIGGYDIPAGTLVFVNVWAIGRDPKVWESPTEFRPERFIGSSVDVKGQDYQLLPFGSGRRMCPGISLGLKMVQLTLANLLHAFVWRLPDGMVAEELSMEEKFGLSVSRMILLKAVAEPKLPAHLYGGP
ncbi:hypothetical protein PR202_gb19921 [Eleusine coracana subsp. coracana]|uniref:Flavonoid 3'-monooxygenase n=1 Tax=Eleusine coracana subsp. coracana TaxID=191504 RepID=A0AAV5F9G0_ELECO|nr:hypothetical protein QOZ80_3BG0279430 [Eleusine coracana subsp. coracana]GJN31512.1 hypothetical protein PR202_gb19921 [Eleusine coracana subsp. coracana]